MSQFLSQKTIQNLKRELQKLKLERKRVATDLSRSAAFGDLAENAEYQQAREEKDYLDKKIFEIDQKIKNSRIGAKKELNGGITLYSEIKIENKDKIMNITLVPPEEIDLLRKKISIKSPLGKSLLGKKKNDIVEVKTPTRKEMYKILEVK